MAVIDLIKEKLRTVPRKPGVYLMKAAGERVLYVGKAKDLRARLGSYFQKSADLDMRKAAMVRQVRDFSTVVTGNELEALALEANLIKQHRPKYNVILRDDKNYPYLKLTMNEQWPRLEVVRRTARDGAIYFGPYVPAGAMWEALDFIKRNFGIRPCKYRLDRQMRPCVQHQMGRCPAPCAGLVERDAYMRSVDEVVKFLKGRSAGLLGDLRAEMGRLSDAMEYEAAARLRDRIAAIESLWEAQKVVAPELGDLDVIAAHMGGAESVVQALFIRSGAMVGAKDFIVRETEDLLPAELMRQFMMMFYTRQVSPPPLILCEELPEDHEVMAEWLGGIAGQRVELRRPERGKKSELVKMAQENAAAAMHSRRTLGVDSTLDELGQRLDLGFAPRTIGAFDVSNITGSDPVGGFVLWDAGEFNTDGYRHVRIREVEGIDDFAMMRETVRRVLGSEGAPEPDLVVIDGGRAHLDAAQEVIAEMALPVAVISVAKKPDRAFVPGRQEPVELSGREPSSLLLRRIRDEVHRFSVGFHKKLRAKRLLSSPLESIEGVGKKRRLALLKAFGSLEGIRSASVEEMAQVEGMNSKVAQAIKEAMGE